MLRNFKNELTIRESNPEAMSLARMFGWIASISRLSTTGSWRQSFLGRSGSSTLLGSKVTSESFLGIGKFMMFSICHCWNRTSQGKRGSFQCQSFSWATIRSTRWKLSKTVQSMQKSQNQGIYQVFTIWFHWKDIEKKKTSGSQPQPSSILESLSARSIKTILTSRQWLFLLSIAYHQWLDQQPSPLSL